MQQYNTKITRKMLNTEPMYSLQDVAIIPATVSSINSRSECNPFYKNGNLPIFTAPMSAVVNTENIQYWENNNIIPILPRNIDYDTRVKFAKICKTWIALSLSEFKNIKSHFCDNYAFNILLDIANGHMQEIYNICYEIKLYALNNFENCAVTIMIGNIANPKTIQYIAQFNASSKIGNVIDYVRCGIGSGSCCVSTSQTSIHYGMASLLNDINKIKSRYDKTIPTIIADGGIKTYNDAITALALGADYVMIGTTFASLYESAADVAYRYRNTGNISEGLTPTLSFSEDEKFNEINTYVISKSVNGMSTYKAQAEIGNKAKVRCSEGIGRVLECHNTIEGWTKAFYGYLTSCMSYCDIKDIKDFVGKVECRVMSPMLNNSINTNIDNHVYEYLHIVK